MYEDLVIKCVEDHGGVWPDYYERYLYWDDRKGWNKDKGEKVYYADFDTVCKGILGKGIQYKGREVTVSFGQEEYKDDHPYWDGESEIEVGMIVGRPCCGTTKFEVILIGEEQTVVRQEQTGRLDTPYTKNLVSLIPDPKEEFMTKMLTDVRKLSIDYIHDTTFDIKTVAGMCWDELGGYSE